MPMGSSHAHDGALVLRQELGHLSQSGTMRVLVERSGDACDVGPYRHAGHGARVGDGHAAVGAARLVADLFEMPAGACLLVSAPLALSAVYAHEPVVLFAAHSLYGWILECRELHHLAVELAWLAGVLLAHVAAQPSCDVEFLHVDVALGFDVLEQVLGHDRVRVEHVMQFGDVLGVRHPHHGRIGAAHFHFAGGVRLGSLGKPDVELRQIAVGMHDVAEPLGMGLAHVLDPHVEVAWPQHAHAVESRAQGHAAGLGLEIPRGLQLLERSETLLLRAEGGGIASEQDREALAIAVSTGCGARHGFSFFAEISGGASLRGLARLHTAHWQSQLKQHGCCPADLRLRVSDASGKAPAAARPHPEAPTNHEG
ncbi:hypothetical protein QFZ42_004395 [Variovorax paradoxus]|nr:hypothetical protein [Variovorax paradoxus]